MSCLQTWEQNTHGPYFEFHLHKSWYKLSNQTIRTSMDNPGCCSFPFLLDHQSKPYCQSFQLPRQCIAGIFFSDLQNKTWNKMSIPPKGPIEDISGCCTLILLRGVRDKGCCQSFVQVFAGHISGSSAGIRHHKFRNMLTFK